MKIHSFFADVIWEKRNIKRIAACILLVSQISFLSGYSLGNDLLPRSLGPLKLIRIQSGEEARREIDRLHGKPIRFKKGYIGFYGSDQGDGRVWVSEYGSQGEATRAVEKMAMGIRKGKGGDFRHFRKERFEEAEVYFVLGMGQAHYFFQKGVKVIWLAVDPPLAKETIKDTIKKIP